MVLYSKFAYGSQFRRKKQFKNPILGCRAIKQKPSLILFGTPCMNIHEIIHLVDLDYHMKNHAIIHLKIYLIVHIDCHLNTLKYVHISVHMNCNLNIHKNVHLVDINCQNPNPT